MNFFSQGKLFIHLLTKEKRDRLIISKEFNNHAQRRIDRNSLGIIIWGMKYMVIFRSHDVEKTYNIEFFSYLKKQTFILFCKWRCAEITYKCEFYLYLCVTLIDDSLSSAIWWYLSLPSNESCVYVGLFIWCEYLWIEQYMKVQSCSIEICWERNIAQRK